MYTPVKPNTTLINKKVIYSDKALNLDDIGTNIEINSISNVSECLLDSCSNEILDSIGDVLSRLYDEYIELKDFSTQFSNNIKSINSNFLVNITSDDINVHMNSKTSDSNKDFSLLYSVHNSDKYKCKCNSSLLFDVVNNNEDQIFRKIFVRIEDCPEWMRDLLYKIRKKQVEYQTIEEIQEQKEQ